MRKIAFSLAFLAACGGNEPAPPEQLVDPGPAPTNGLQIILPVHEKIAPGSDNELCTWTSVTADKDMHIKWVQAFQSETGHHVVIYKTKTYQPPGTSRPCTDDDMATFRYVAGAGGEGQTMKSIAPGDLAYSVEKGFQIVVNEHFLNASPKEHDGQSAINMEFADPSKPFIPSGAFTVVDTKFKLAQGNPEIDIKCTLENDFKVWFAIPHMHRWGTRISVDHIPSSPQAQPARLFDTMWDPKYTFEPPEMRAEPSQPMLFHKGDKVNVHCLWKNDTGKVLTFGPEMCVFFAQTVDDVGQGNIACDAGEWTDF